MYLSRGVVEADGRDTSQANCMARIRQCKRLMAARQGQPSFDANCNLCGMIKLPEDFRETAPGPRQISLIHPFHDAIAKYPLPPASSFPIMPACLWILSAHAC